MKYCYRYRAKDHQCLLSNQSFDFLSNLLAHGDQTPLGVSRSHETAWEILQTLRDLGHPDEGKRVVRVDLVDDRVEAAHEGDTLAPPIGADHAGVHQRRDAGVRETGKNVLTKADSGTYEEARLVERGLVRVP